MMTDAEFEHWYEEQRHRQQGATAPAPKPLAKRTEPTNTLEKQKVAYRQAQAAARKAKEREEKEAYREVKRLQREAAKALQKRASPEERATQREAKRLEREERKRIAKLERETLPARCARYDVHGQQMSLIEMVKEYGISETGLRKRLKHMSATEAVDHKRGARRGVKTVTIDGEVIPLKVAAARYNVANTTVFKWFKIYGPEYTAKYLVSGYSETRMGRPLKRDIKNTPGGSSGLWS